VGQWPRKSACPASPARTNPECCECWRDVASQSVEGPWREVVAKPREEEERQEAQGRGTRTPRHSAECWLLLITRLFLRERRRGRERGQTRLGPRKRRRARRPRTRDADPAPWWLGAEFWLLLITRLFLRERRERDTAPGPRAG